MVERRTLWPNAPTCQLPVGLQQRFQPHPPRVTRRAMPKTCVALRRHAFLVAFTVVCSVISLVGYCWDGSIPVFMIGPQTITGVLRETVTEGGIPTSCSPPKKKSSILDSNATMSKNASGFPFIAPEPSKVEGIIPMRVLMQKVSMGEHRGLSLLDHVSLSRYYECQPAKMLLLNQAAGTASKSKSSEERCTKMSFQIPNHPIVALVSFHGSGNTWVRYLLEQATGVYSGSIYCDPSLKVTFPGEGIVSGSVVAVKTHQANNLKLPKQVQ